MFAGLVGGRLGLVDALAEDLRRRGWSLRTGDDRARARPAARGVVSGW